MRAELAKALGALREELFQLFRNHNSHDNHKTKLRNKTHVWSDRATAEMAEKLPVSHGLLAWREAEPSTTLTRDPGRDSGPGLL